MTKASPEDQLQLLQVQELDTKIAQLVHQRKTLPVLTKIKDLTDRKADLDLALVNSRTAAQDLRRELTKAEGDVEQVENRISRNQSRLDAGQGTPKELTALQSELAALQKRHGDLEDVQLEVMERLEDHQEALEKLQAAVEAVELDLEAAEAERDQQDLEIVTEGRAASADRKKVAEAISADLMKLYETVRARVGQGAAPLRARRCQGCQLELNAQELARIQAAAPDAILRCDECGRILVRTPESGL
ncbi:MAG TPA: C4-type zinc ribbon domain-containing protein [Actinomycetales bacterium]|nr:C4-type zinc ribbon domain-containing protein [Actinomycetales bacterium]